MIGFLEECTGQGVRAPQVWDEGVWVGTGTPGSLCFALISASTTFPPASGRDHSTLATHLMLSGGVLAERVWGRHPPPPFSSMLPGALGCRRYFAGEAPGLRGCTHMPRSHSPFGGSARVRAPVCLIPESCRPCWSGTVYRGAIL